MLVIPEFILIWQNQMYNYSHKIKNGFNPISSRNRIQWMLISHPLGFKYIQDCGQNDVWMWSTSMVQERM